MKTRTYIILLQIFSALLSAVLIVLAFPPYDIGWLVWVGLLPLLVIISGKGPKSSFILSLLCGMLFFLGIFDWILEVPGYTLLHHGMLAVYLGFFFAVFGIAFSLISKQLSFTTALFAAPFVWVSLEYVRSNMFFLALPWGLLAHTQYQTLPIIQVASVSGTYGVSFLIVLVNSALAATVIAFLSKFKKNNPLHTDREPSKQGLKMIVFSALVLVTVSLICGYVLMTEQTGEKKIKIALVQGNIDQDKKWDAKYAKFIMQTYADLTREASGNKPSLIIWPETATPKSISVDKALNLQVRRIAKDAGTYLLLGSSQRQKFKGATSSKIKIFNSAFLISPDNRTSFQPYSKIRLFPFGEYLPMKETIPWSYMQVPDIKGFESGDEFTVFKCPSFQFSVTICWENLFSDLVRQFVKAGAQFIVNMTNEAWFGQTVAPYQFLSMNVFRAVENRVFVIRCANTGISCFIDPNGKIVDRLKDENGQDIFIRGVLNGEISPEDGKTFYTNNGDVFAFLCLLVSVVFMVMAILKKKTVKHFKGRRF